MPAAARLFMKLCMDSSPIPKIVVVEVVLDASREPAQWCKTSWNREYWAYSLPRSLIRLHRTARFARALRCAHSLAHSLAHSGSHGKVVFVYELNASISYCFSPLWFLSKALRRLPSQLIYEKGTITTLPILLNEKDKSLWSSHYLSVGGHECAKLTVIPHWVPFPL